MNAPAERERPLPRRVSAAQRVRVTAPPRRRKSAPVTRTHEIDEGTEDFLFPQNNTYFLFGKNEEGAALREDVDKALKEMKEDGTLSKITTEYLGVDTSPDEKYFDETPN